MQPLDRTVYQHLKKYFEQEVNSLHKNYAGRIINKYNISKLCAPIYLKAAIAKNAVSGFKYAGLWPCIKKTQNRNTYVKYAKLRIRIHQQKTGFSAPCASSGVMNPALHIVELVNISAVNAKRGQLRVDRTQTSEEDDDRADLRSVQNKSSTPRKHRQIDPGSGRTRGRSQRPRKRIRNAKPVGPKCPSRSHRGAAHTGGCEWPLSSPEGKPGLTHPISGDHSDHHEVLVLMTRQWRVDPRLDKPLPALHWLKASDLLVGNP
ncbi:hypothetical protein PR048_008235, partial [Dryococelus australis]